MHSSKQTRKTWSLTAWAKHYRQSYEAQTRAQDALDAATQTAPVPPQRGSLYRTGVTLAEIQPGECGTIRFLIGSTQGRQPLLEMGLTPGVHVKVLRAAAFGGPLDVLVRGYQLSLRREEAVAIWLGEEDDESPKTPPGGIR
jgi:Fe2+ transport system protein FeoA